MRCAAFFLVRESELRWMVRRKKQRMNLPVWLVSFLCIPSILNVFAGAVIAIARMMRWRVAMARTGRRILWNYLAKIGCTFLCRLRKIKVWQQQAKTSDAIL